ncbi:MAG TPA: hypothetical protein PLL10_00065 [Elusimicrobiales bacterium]|nr:hypothetical protein [Elusimicrobiales bacterium]
MATAEKINGTTAAELGRQIEAAMRAQREAEISKYKPTGLIASNLGPCRRERVLSVACWDQKPAPDAEGMERMAQGSDAERRAIARLLTLGFEVVEGQLPFEIKGRDGTTTILKGKIDGKLKVGRRRVPFEHKYWAPHVVERINDARDFERYEWTKKALRQMQAYLYANNEPDGLFILWDGRGFPKCIAVDLDFEEMERLLTECEADTAHLKAGTLPDHCGEASVCRRCWAFGVCCQPPDVDASGAVVVDDDELISLLELREQMSPYADEFEAADKKVKDALKARGVDRVIAGPFEARISTQVRRSKVYPADAAFEEKLAEVKVVKIHRVKD